MDLEKDMAFILISLVNGHIEWMPADPIMAECSSIKNYYAARSCLASAKLIESRVGYLCITKRGDLMARRLLAAMVSNTAGN